MKTPYIQSVGRVNRNLKGPAMVTDFTERFGANSMITDPVDGKIGLRIESAASITARDMIQKHLGVFALAVRHDRAASQSTAAAYIDGLAGVMALTIAGGFGSRDEVWAATVSKLQDAITRDLKTLK